MNSGDLLSFVRIWLIDLFLMVVRFGGRFGVVVFLVLGWVDEVDVCDGFEGFIGWFRFICFFILLVIFFICMLLVFCF